MTITLTRRIILLASLAISFGLTASNQQELVKNLWKAIGTKNKGTAQVLIKKTPKNQINRRDDDGWTLLTWAIYSGNTDEIITALIKNGADIDAATKSGNTPLILAITGNRSDIVELLITLGADPNTGTINDMSPLHLAISGGNTKLIKELLAAGADANRQNKKGVSSLAQAVKENNKQAVELILAHGKKLERATLRDAHELAQKLGYFDIEYLLENRLEA